MTRAGLIIAGRSGSFKSETIYNSNLSKLTVDPDIDPPHLDIIDNLSGGTKWVIPSGDGVLREETLLRIKHNMPFIPQVQAYLRSTVSKQYGTNSYLMVYNLADNTEWVDVETDEEWVYIIHRAQRDLSASGSWTASGSDITLIVRYFIFNRPTPIVQI